MTPPSGRDAAPHFVPPDLNRPFVIAHRGASLHAPENTLLAFRMAFAAGADAVELDVRPTADGQLVVLHDPTLERTTDGRGAVAHLTLSEIAGLRCRHGSRRTQEPIPALVDVLQWLPPEKRCLVEVKTRDGAGLVLDLVGRLGAGDRVGICSFLASELRSARTRAPRLPLVLNIARWRCLNRSGLVEQAAMLGAGGVFLFPEVVTADLVRQAHDLGLEVHAGPVDDTAAARRLVALGVDAVETDDPAAIADGEAGE